LGFGDDVRTWFRPAVRTESSPAYIQSPHIAGDMAQEQIQRAGSGLQLGVAGAGLTLGHDRTCSGKHKELIVVENGEPIRHATVFGYAVPTKESGGETNEEEKKSLSLFSLFLSFSLFFSLFLS